MGKLSQSETSHNPLIEPTQSGANGAAHGDYRDYIDAHCHLMDPRLDQIRSAVIQRAQEKGVKFFIQGGVGPEDWERQVTLSEEYPGQIFPCFGIHPWWVFEHSELECEVALKLLGMRLAQAVALGELGLDLGPKAPVDSLALQTLVFRKQLELAREMGKPLVLHLVKAHDLALKELKAAQKESDRPLKGIVHSFSGSLNQAQAYIDLGLSISVGGPLARAGYERLKDAVKKIPLENLVLESDAPDQTSDLMRGQLNEPGECLWEVARVVGELKNITPEEVLIQSQKNCRSVFDLCL